MRKQLITGLMLATMLTAAGMAQAQEKEANLPAGPIYDRHELMEGIGDNAKIIGGALKTGKLEPVAGAAEQIQASAAKVLPLFPKGSTDPKSRAKDEIWQQWDKFQSLMEEMETKAGELAAAAKSGGDVGAAADAMFGSCKSCHDEFRKPEEKKDGGKS